MRATIRRIGIGWPQLDPRASVIAAETRPHSSVSTARRFAAGFGEAIELGATIVVGLTPRRDDPTVVLEAVEGGEQRSGLDVVGAARDLRDPPCDAESVHVGEGEALEDQQVERAL